MRDLQDTSTAITRTPVEGDIAKGTSFVGILLAALVIAAIVFYLGNRWPAKDQGVSRK